MNRLYEIEAISASSATFSYRYIQSMGGQCLRRGSAVITDFGFDIECPPELLTHISTVNDRLSGNDLEKWAVSQISYRGHRDHEPLHMSYTFGR